MELEGLKQGHRSILRVVSLRPGSSESCLDSDPSESKTKAQT